LLLHPQWSVQLDQTNAQQKYVPKSVEGIEYAEFCEFPIKCMAVQ